MTQTQLKQNVGNGHLACFYCFSILRPEDKYVAVCTGEEVIVIRNSRNQEAPMIFCSSDCMVFDCHLRYQDRVRNGTFRKKFDTKYKDRFPERWGGTEEEAVIK